MKTNLIRPVNHLKRPVTHLDDQWNFPAKSFDLLFSSEIIMYSEMHILHEDFLRAANISTKGSFSLKQMRI